MDPQSARLDRPPYNLTEIRYELLAEITMTTHIPAQTTPMYAAPILRTKGHLSQKSRV